MKKSQLVFSKVMNQIGHVKYENKLHKNNEHQ